ncbi:MAG: hypothetical protein AMK73_00025 [Planctomycetes bacterium SM23_32]|nr:MAG: hypothetical protein AMK73_00025 [Planctomycetes bacterium SM23_32]
MAANRSSPACAVVSCGTLRGELEALEQDGSLNAERLFFTAPGLHEAPRQLEEQLVRQLAKAREVAEKVIVVYGARCFVDFSNPSRDVDALLREQGRGIRRVDALNCVDMLADARDRERIAGRQRIYWLTPGWLRHWRYIFRDWDSGKANETFPQNDRAVLLDGIGLFGQWSTEKPEEVLAFSDWMKIPIEPVGVSLDRLRALLRQAAQ